MSNKYSKTINCCLLGYVVQAIINNYVPLLFVTFNRDFGVSLEKISLIITINFAVQISADLISSKFIDKIGYRMAVVVAHAFSFAGLLTLAVLPNVMDAYTGLVISTVVCAMGGGLIEV
ncbi:MAG: MFS transporter, partial [Clostridia bacterium]|nr:MFS transporter [Clostridia bacterium]